MKCGFPLALLSLCAAFLMTIPAAHSAEPGWKGRNPNDENTIRFVVISDRTGGPIPGAWEKAVAEINRLQPDFVISIGDIIQGYTASEALLIQQWEEIEQVISRFDAPYYYCAGNHDVIAGGGADQTGRNLYLARHGVDGKSYYSFDIKNTHFVVIDSTIVGTPANQQQLEWLKADIEKARDARHIFAFYHHPQGGESWSALASILPKGRTTVFNGHTHAMSFRPADQIPVYVLSSTGANINPENPAAQHIFAYVAMQEKPIISFIPTGSVQPDTYLETRAHLRDLVMGGDAIFELPAGGGEVTLSYANPLKEPVEVSISAKPSGWKIEPATHHLHIPAGEKAEATFTATADPSHAARPVLAEEFITADGTFTRARTIAAYQTGTLADISEFKADGSLDEWRDVPSLAINDASLLFLGADKWGGAADSSCLIRAATSGDTLAVAVEVTDDHVVTVPEGKGWAQDGVEVCWDVRPRAGSRMTEGTGQIIFNPADPATPPVWVAAGVEQPEKPASVQAVARKTTTGYVAEFAFPKADLGLAGGTLADGKLRLSVSLNDLDPDQNLKRFSLTGTDEFWRSVAGYARFSR